jgi:hypothetical protein
VSPGAGSPQEQTGSPRENNLSLSRRNLPDGLFLFDTADSSHPASSPLREAFENGPDTLRCNQPVATERRQQDDLLAQTVE